MKEFFVSLLTALTLASVPAQARFLQTDPVGYGPDLNLYTYVNNDPIDKTDPSGKGPEVVCLVAPEACITAVSATVNLIGAAVLTAAKHDSDSKKSQNSNKAGAVNDGKSGDNKTPDPNQSGTPAPSGKSNATQPYQRPSNATTRTQRQSVQGKPCVKCGETTPRQVAGHKEPLVKEYHQTGTIDTARMRSPEAVQPECPTCSAREGADLSRYSREMNETLPEEGNQ